ncbi:multifunctional CCA addition/repair protein [Stutzerimonas urumqiensis]|uniref:multifunctional CCA addition/repair protein n=1 Tax=Stutzerimonas urumqiensis TaxID=638269 RepID=UPI003BA92357
MNIYKVGGAVRDRLLGRPVTEVDYVVVGATPDDMLSQGFRPVGADFPVFLHPATGEEYALARTERKSGRGYGGFTFYASPDVTLEQDLIRRDLTINAMAEDDDGRIIDPYGGQRDLDSRLLRHVSDAFAEDPLRVLRAARFAARYADLGFRVADETQALMRQLAESGELRDLTPERAWKEISRALLEPRPEVFIQVLHDCGALAELLPDVERLLVSSDGGHTLEALRHCARSEQPLAVRWACLLLGLASAPSATDADASADSGACAGLVAIARLNESAKPPRDCQELALLTGEFHGVAVRALALSAEQLLGVLQRFDVYRRPERFEHFIAVCEMDARAHDSRRADAFTQAAYLRSAAQAVRSVQPRPLIEAGYQGAALGEAINQARLATLAEHRAAWPHPS